MPTRLDDDVYAPVAGARHFNVRYQGDVLCNHVTARHFVGANRQQIEWVWMIETKRYANPQEIALLCAGKPLK